MSFFQRLEKRRSIVNGEPHTWDLTPPQQYEKSLSNSSKFPPTLIPHPDVFRDAIVPSLKPEYGANTNYPNPGHLAVHLSLLECFLRLKQSVLNSHELNVLDLPSYSPTPVSAPFSAPVPSPNSRRWSVVVRLAVARFQVWYENIESTLTHASAYHRFGPGSHAYHAAITPNYLPPLDVLLVWYAYMQQPSAYRCDNLAHSFPKLLEIPMPWEAILAVIDLDSLVFKIPVAAEKLFMTTTSQSPDILDYLEHPPPYSDLNTEQAFSIDLAAAVHGLVDDASFIETMHEHLWLRSPSLEGTLTRGIAQYSALAQATGRQASLWLHRVQGDILLQLVWRTHMLYPMAYLHYSNITFGDNCLLNVTDELTHAIVADIKMPLTSEQSATADLIQANGTQSSGMNTICHCWTCERIRDDDQNYEHTSNRTTIQLSSAILNSIDGPPRNSFRAMTIPQPASPSSGVAFPLSKLSKEQISAVKADLIFYRYVEKFRSSKPPGTPLPSRAASHRESERPRAGKDIKNRVG
ncbi:hypothetical protein PV10_03665 [Exophiala mesophila]|uniref:Uncharacterized protein n=1 Tax=Exophiala mesophila TaxID=212818 RepID=A0A0D1X2X0_EXOME|nr:uncharacterized protein PV10_03665 [Exophiala mesophila]KIV96085.1 hypothetical protein PV10_03665 [Exophiala mesophila]